MASCRVCGEELFEVDMEDVYQWQDENGDILCPAKDWDDGAGPYHEPKEST